MDYQGIIKIVRQILNCPICGRPFEEKKVFVAAKIDDKVIIQSSCGLEHLPIVVIFITAFSELESNRIGIEAKKNQITQNDLLNLSRALETFNGNFQAIFTALKLPN